MAPLPVINDVFRCVLEWTGAPGHAVNVLHIRGVGKTATQVMTALNANANSDMWFGVNSSMSVTTVVITKLDGSSAGVPFTPATPANWDGGEAGQYVPALAGLVSIRTAQRGSRGRGRVYLPFWSETENDGGKWASSTNRNSCLAAWGVFAGALAAAGLELGVASYKHADFHVLSTIDVPVKLATQRPRQSRVA
jgi:hypothetical protein